MASLQLAPLQPQQHGTASHVPSDKIVNTWRLLRLRRSLGASGFHRVLHLEAALEHTDGGRSTPLAPPGETAPDVHARKGSDEVAAEPGLGPAAARAKACKVAMVQPLPAAVYADVDQLAALQAAGTSFQAELFGTHLRCPACCRFTRGATPASLSPSFLNCRIYLELMSECRIVRF